MFIIFLHNSLFVVGHSTSSKHAHYRLHSSSLPLILFPFFYIFLTTHDPKKTHINFMKKTKRPEITIHIRFCSIEFLQHKNDHLIYLLQNTNDIFCELHASISCVFHVLLKKTAMHYIYMHRLWVYFCHSAIISWFRMKIRTQYNQSMNYKKKSTKVPKVWTESRFDCFKRIAYPMHHR